MCYKETGLVIGDGNIRGLCIGKQMIGATLNIAFDQLKLHRVSLGVFDFNESATACYEKAGFVKDGLLRDARKREINIGVYGK